MSNHINHRRALPEPSYLPGLPLTQVTWSDGGYTGRVGHLSDAAVAALRPAAEPVHVKRTTTDTDRACPGALAYASGGTYTEPSRYRMIAHPEDDRATEGM